MVVKYLLRLSFLYFLCSITLSTQTDLFDLYELSHWRNWLPEHIQKDIISYYNTCICIDAMPEQVDCLEFVDRATIKVLARKRTRAYSIRLHERYYQLDLLESADFNEHISLFSNVDAFIGRWIANTQSVIALSPFVSIKMLTLTQKSHVHGFCLREHHRYKTQWYLWAWSGDVVRNCEPIPLENTAGVFFIATVVGNNVHIFKRREQHFEYFTCLPHPALVTAAAFSPDNTRIVTACKDNTLRVWPLLSAPASKLVTLEQLLLFKLLHAACYYEGSWDLDDLARRLQVPLAENLDDQTHAGVVAYLCSIFKTLSLESQHELNLWRKVTAPQLKKQHWCVLC